MSSTPSGIAKRAKLGRSLRLLTALAALAALTASLASGCALLSKSEPMTVRWFSPERAKTQLTAAEDGAPKAAALPLEMGRVTSGPHLREKIVHRDSAVELGYYDDRQWTERPETYVRRALGRVLFEEGRFARALGGPVPALEVEVVAFEEVRSPAGKAARVTLRIVLHEGAKVLLEETVSVERPVAPAGRIEDVVVSISEALDVVMADVARRVGAALAPRG
jgi:cholesterol transport system auxiliary component